MGLLESILHPARSLAAPPEHSEEIALGGRAVRTHAPHGGGRLYYNSMLAPGGSDLAALLGEDEGEKKDGFQEARVGYQTPASVGLRAGRAAKLGLLGGGTTLGLSALLQGASETVGKRLGVPQELLLRGRAETVRGARKGALIVGGIGALLGAALPYKDTPVGYARTREGSLALRDLYSRMISGEDVGDIPRGAGIQYAYHGLPKTSSPQRQTMMYLADRLAAATMTKTSEDGDFGRHLGTAALGAGALGAAGYGAGGARLGDAILRAGQGAGDFAGIASTANRTQAAARAGALRRLPSAAAGRAAGALGRIAPELGLRTIDPRARIGAGALAALLGVGAGYNAMRD